jgi:hypothetical protein
MIAASALALLALFVAPARSAPQAQVPLSAPAAARALRGRFLHLTDMHPDPFYAAGVPTHLHRKKEKVPHEHSACHPKVRAPGTFEGQEAYKYSGPWGTPARCVLCSRSWETWSTYMRTAGATRPSVSSTPPSPTSARAGRTPSTS